MRFCVSLSSTLALPTLPPFSTRTIAGRPVKAPQKQLHARQQERAAAITARVGRWGGAGRGRLGVVRTHLLAATGRGVDLTRKKTKNTKERERERERRGTRFRLRSGEGWSCTWRGRDECGRCGCALSGARDGAGWAGHKLQTLGRHWTGRALKIWRKTKYISSHHSFQPLSSTQRPIPHTPGWPRPRPTWPSSSGPGAGPTSWRTCE